MTALKNSGMVAVMFVVMVVAGAYFIVNDWWRARRGLPLYELEP